MTHTTPEGARAGGPAVLGIDLGTSSVKVVIANLEGDLIAQTDAAYPVTSPRAGWSETNPDAWLSSTTAAVRGAVAQARADVVAIGFSGQMHGVVAADRTGTPLRPAMLWSDARATAELTSYRRLPAPARARLANPLSPGMAGPQLAWLKQHEPDVYQAVTCALSPKDWLRSRLTGQFATEPSDASATLMYDLVNDSWDLQVLDVLGLDPGKLAPILPSSAHPAGQLTAASAQLLGLEPGIPVAAGAADTAAAALGSGLIDPATAQLTLGTGAQVVRPVTALPADLPPEPVTHLYRSAAETGWYSMAAGLNGGSTLAWARAILGASWQELYDCAALSRTDDTPLFLPHLHGERTPYLDPGMRGAWTGLAPHHRREDLLYAALEGVAFAIREAADCLLSPGHHVTELRLAGGGTTAPAWRQMLADILERPLTPIDVPGASAVGAALLARQVPGLPGPTVNRAADPADGPSNRATCPRPEASRVHLGRYARYREQVAALRPGGARTGPLSDVPIALTRIGP
jgi:xylulokinase